ncbi:MAG: hypothetical protein AAFV45_11355 [Pseudomonadota bacterium]
MPQALLFTLMGVGMYAGYRVARGISHAARERRDGRGRAADTDAQSGSTSPSPQMREMGSLRRDPETGVYRAP